MSKKVGARKALQFFKDNYIMISSCEAKREEGCAEKMFEYVGKIY